MEQIAFISGEVIVYWSAILTVLGAAVAVFVFLALYLYKSGNWVGAMLLVPLAALLSVVLSRLLHWYGYPAGYEDLVDALTDYSSGGFVLAGVFAGCLLAAARLRHSSRIKNLPQALDCMAIAGAAGIAVGRLASMYNASDRGALLENWTQLPVASASVNVVTGETEYYFATFLFQAMGAALLFVGLLVWYLPNRVRPGRKDGDACLLFLLLYCAMQAVLDSTRYDSLYLRSNGFVSLVQILCVVGLVAVAAVFSLRLVRAMGWRYWFLALWLAQAAALGGAGYMEYYVQRHGDEALFAYSVMSACLVVFVALTLTLRILMCKAERRKLITQIL